MFRICQILRNFLLDYFLVQFLEVLIIICFLSEIINLISSIV